MSLVGTLGKIAMGALVAKGVTGMMANKGGGAGGGLGGLGGLLGGAMKGGGGGGLGGLLSGALQGGGARGGQQGGGLGGLGELLGGGGQQQGGGLGGLLDSLGGGAAGGAAAGGAGGGLGDLLNSALQGNEQPSNPTAEQQAELLMRAMLNAAKADGQIDQVEQQKITEQLDGVDAEEAEFIRKEMASPMDFDSFVRSVPQGMEQQVYFMSLLAIDLDSQAEAQYLDKLAKGLNISQQQSNAIHQQVGAPALYS